MHELPLEPPNGASHGTAGRRVPPADITLGCRVHLCVRQFFDYFILAGNGQYLRKKQRAF